MRIILTTKTKEKLQKELQRAQALNNLRLYKMVLCILLVHKQYTMKKTSEILNVSNRTVYIWLTMFMVKGFYWLLMFRYQGRGRKSKLSKAEKEKLYKIVEAGPEEYGFESGIWTSAMIAEAIMKEFNVIYNPRYVCSLLKKIGLTYQRAAFESDHLDEEKRKEWERKKWPKILKVAKAKKAVIVFVDEVSFAQWGSLGRTWAPKGKQPKVKTTGKRKALKIFGAIEFFSGVFEYMECDRKFNGEKYIIFLKKLLDRFSGPIFLIEDSAPYHTPKIVKEFKADMRAQGRLFVYHLPKYSPDYNPIEKLWKNTKRDATHCKYFPTFENLRGAVIKAFKKYMEDATKVICVMKKLRDDASVISLAA
jgi:transposase